MALPTEDVPEGDGAPPRAAGPAPDAHLEPLTRSELALWFKGGEPEADECERLLASAARARGAVDVAIAEGLDLLRRGDRLARLAYHLDDYGREVLDVGETTTRKLAKLGAELRRRPVLREALRSGRIGIRAAEIVLPVALGDAEGRWVERAALQTVRDLEQAVRSARDGSGEEEEEWFRLRTHLPDPDREVLDHGLELAGKVEPEFNRLERFEAIAQELLGALSDEDVGDALALGSIVRPVDPGQRSRRAALERETECWAALPTLPAIVAPDLQLDELSTAEEVDTRLRQLAALRSSCDDLVGWCAHALRRGGVPALLGFATFRHYVEERLGLPPRALEQREALERRLWASPALREARRQRVGYEKLRILSRLPERDIAAWIPRARALTCIALRRRVEGERDRQMRVARTLVVSMPRRIAVVLAAAVHAVRQRWGRTLSVGKCLAVMAWHFAATWSASIAPVRTRSQKVRERDEGLCQVPGCSRRAQHAHHVMFRSRGGGDELSNQVGVCAFHHQRCIHPGYLRVVGRAPDALTWFLGDKPWNGCTGVAAAAA